MDANVILRRFASTPEAERSSSSGLSDHDWRKLDRLVRAAVTDSHQYKARKLRSSVHHLSVQNELLNHKVDGLEEALQHKKKHKKKGKALDLQQRQEYHGGSVFWSPRKLREARAREAVRERDETEEKLQKAQAKKQRKEAQLQRQVELEQRRVERQRLKEAKELERAEKAAERARKVEAQHQKKTIQQAQQRKRKASQVTLSSNKRQKRASAAHAGDQARDGPSAALPKVTLRGRNVSLPQKYR
ncbi:TolA Membrane protein [Pyrenophora tritici-repentis]|nr:TolA Membrane protein [Pyrenophora tritici-repentis]